jgi:hypothetical protein
LSHFTSPPLQVLKSVLLRSCSVLPSMPFLGMSWWPAALDLCLFPLSHREHGSCNYLSEFLCSQTMYPGVGREIGSEHCSMKPWQVPLCIDFSLCIPSRQGMHYLKKIFLSKT